MPQMTPAEFAGLLPLAVAWVEAQEAEIQRVGRPLAVTTLEFAKKLGIEQPERVRLLEVDAIPLPEHPALRQAMEAGAMPVGEGEGSGLCLRYGIYVRRGSLGDTRLIVHELVHTRQYERSGGIDAFIREYMAQIAGGNYFSAPFEVEARRRAAELCP